MSEIAYILLFLPLVPAIAYLFKPPEEFDPRLIRTFNILKDMTIRIDIWRLEQMIRLGEWLLERWPWLRCLA